PIRQYTEHPNDCGARLPVPEARPPDPARTADRRRDLHGGVRRLRPHTRAVRRAGRDRRQPGARRDAAVLPDRARPLDDRQRPRAARGQGMGRAHARGERPAHQAPAHPPRRAPVARRCRGSRRTRPAAHRRTARRRRAPDLPAAARSPGRMQQRTVAGAGAPGARIARRARSAIMKEAKVLVVGGGIGGLAAALVLGRDGHRVEVLEQSDEFREIGAGPQIRTNALRTFGRLGLTEAIDRVAWYPGQLRRRDVRTGEIVAEMPVAEKSKLIYGFPYGVIYRVDLHNVFLEACRALPNV